MGDVLGAMSSTPSKWTFALTDGEDSGIQRIQRPAFNRPGKLSTGVETVSTAKGVAPGGAGF
jgi:hypothetical protein